MFCAASCFCRPGEARELVTLGARGGEGMDTPPGCPVLPVGRFTWTQPLGWGVGAGGMPTFGLEGAGCWQWAVGWAGVLSREAQQGNATKPPKCFSYAHPSRGD